jgi:FAD/FMN-containing dehydrogenase
VKNNQTYLDELVAITGKQHVLVDSAEIRRSLRDNSWLSPLLSQYIDQRRASQGETLQVSAVVAPQSLAQLGAVIALSVRHHVPMVVRGGGTSNFGQTVPLAGGIILDMRGLRGVVAMDDTSITVAAGTLQGEVDEAARRHGKELTVLTTTYASATAAGWVAGGHVGLGANSYGTIWDGNVLAVKLLTAEDPPRELTLRGEELTPVLHTYGTTGVITEVTFPLVKAHDWLEAVGVFDSFEDAVKFTEAMAGEHTIVQRVVAAQDGATSTGFTPLEPLFNKGQSLVLMIVDGDQEERCRTLCRHYGGQFKPWQRTAAAEKISLGLMVYGHRMLWIKKIAPDAAFLHIYYDPDRFQEQRRLIKQRLGDRVWEEYKYIGSTYLRRVNGLSGDGPLPAAVLTLTPGSQALVEEAMAACSAAGVQFMNPHTFLLEESRLFLDFQPIADFKRQVDPKGLLNPGKIGERYFTPQRV